VLILGWNHIGPTLIFELDSFGSETFEVDVVSRLPVSEREALVERLNVHSRDVRVRHIEADFTSPSDLERLGPAKYDDILLLASDWMETDAANDSRTVLGYLVLQELLADTEKPPNIIVELLNPDSAGLFRRRSCELVVTPQLVSHLLTQGALRRELLGVFEDLFGPGGGEISFHALSEYIETPIEGTFDVVQSAILDRGGIALGVRLSGSKELVLNPPRTRRFTFQAGDDVVVLRAAL
jgi:hypothetical protein